MLLCRTSACFKKKKIQKNENETLDQALPILRKTGRTRQNSRRSLVGVAITLSIAGTKPSAPGPPFKPNNDSATARAAAHERIDAQRHTLVQPSFATKGLLPGPLLQPTDSRNFVFQQTTGLPLHLPARTNDICCEGQLALDWCFLCEFHSIPVCRFHASCPIGMGGSNKGCVDGQLASSEQRQTVSHDLQSSAPAAALSTAKPLLP